MDEQQATIVAEALGGTPWQSGGDVWLVVLERADGKVVVISDEAVGEYESTDAVEVGHPSASVLLR